MAFGYLNEVWSQYIFTSWHHICWCFSGPLFVGHALWLSTELGTCFILSWLQLVMSCIVWMSCFLHWYNCCTRNFSCTFDNFIIFRVYFLFAHCSDYKSITWSLGFLMCFFFLSLPCTSILRKILMNFKRVQSSSSPRTLVLRHFMGSGRGERARLLIGDSRPLLIMPLILVLTGLIAAN